MNALYDTIGKGYADYRKPDPRIAAMIEDALGDARTVINIGAGTGSYESARTVAAIEPASTMIAQRQAGAPKATLGVAENLPFPDGSFGAATAFLTTHHWSDLDKGLREMKRVSRGPCVFLDHSFKNVAFWLVDDYFPQSRTGRDSLLPLDVARTVFDDVRVVPVPVPHDCTDGFLCAYWRRPEKYLERSVRAAISFFANVREDDPGLGKLRRDLDDGTWARRNAALLNKTEMDYGYRIVIAR